VIRLERVSFAYPGGRPVIEDLEFSFQGGDRVGIVGANGSGKTTLLHLLMGLIRPDRGKVFLFGKEMAGEGDFREARRRMGFVFQDADDQLFCPSVAEDVAFGPRNLGRSAEEAHEIVHRTLGILGIEHLESRVTYRLSGGEKRLVALATALAMEPEVLIMDEPTTALSDKVSAGLIDILEENAGSLIVVSHDRAFLKKTVGRMLSLEGGRLHPLPD
jgi:cobalt/nickel transport system ATP-binding protein